MMNTQLTHLVAQQRGVDLREAAALARRGRDLDRASEPRRLIRAIRRLMPGRRPVASPAPAAACD